MRRDPFGQHPLYYTEDGRTASSVRALGPVVLDPDAVAAALCGVLDPGRSLFRGIRRVPPGHELRPGPSTAAWWEPPLAVQEIAADAAQNELLLRLRAALHRLAPGPRAACSLSGGLDSSTLVALLAERDLEVTAWTIADDFAEDGELERARDVAARFRAEHRLVPVSEEELPEHAAEAVRACEDLLWNGRAVASHLFFGAIRETSLVSGVGADEVLGGDAASTERAEAERALALSLLEPEAAARITPPRRASFVEVLAESALPPECRASAAAGIEVRLPFLEPDVAEFGLTLPASLRAGKWLLRQAVRDRLPEAVVAAPKRPRLAPPGGRSRRARERWLSFYSHWLASERLQGLTVVAPRVCSLLDSFRRLDPSDPRRDVQDPVLMKLASAAILQGTFACPGPSPKQMARDV